MEINTATDAMAALAQETRLRVFRLLVEAGSGGLSASVIADTLGIPANTLSFHVKNLLGANLVQARREGRFIYYAANFEHMEALLGFLTTNCCRGAIQRAAS